MPVYVYRCDTCGVAFEKKQSVNEAPVCECPECDGQVRRVYQPVGVVFKGSGWYVTDSRGKKATVEPASGGNGSNGNDGSSAPGAAGDKPGDKPSVEAKEKPEAKKAVEPAAKDK